MASGARKLNLSGSLSVKDKLHAATISRRGFNAGSLVLQRSQRSNILTVHRSLCTEIPSVLKLRGDMQVQIGECPLLKNAGLFMSYRLLSGPFQMRMD